MRKQYYKATIGIDNGSAESGPIIECCAEYIKAKNYEQADRRVQKIIERDYNNQIEGYYIEPADMNEVLEYIKAIKEFPALPFC